MKSALKAVIITFVALALVVYLLKMGEQFSRLVFAVGGVFAIVLIPLGRAVSSLLVRWLTGRNLMTQVILSDGLAMAAPPGFHEIDMQRLGLQPDISCVASITQLGRMLGNADRVVVACVPERRLAWSTALKGIDVDVQMAYPELDAIGPLGLSRVGGKTTLKVGTGPLSRADQALKRMFDLAVVAIILPIVAPLMVLIALAVRLDSPGPIFFRQIRIGRCNRHFNMFKFRSMHEEASDQDGNRSMRRGDDRVTRVGRFIRMTSIDELPQLLNVLFGTMSIVGPRPHAVGSTAADRLFWDIDQRYWHRHAIKPGLTGLAQVRGFRGATVIEADLTNRLQADLEYIAGWNIGRDVMIVMRTFRVLLHDNAY